MVMHPVHYFKPQTTGFSYMRHPLPTDKNGPARAGYVEIEIGVFLIVCKKIGEKNRSVTLVRVHSPNLILPLGP